MVESENRGNFEVNVEAIEEFREGNIHIEWHNGMPIRIRHNQNGNTITPIPIAHDPVKYPQGIRPFIRKVKTLGGTVLLFEGKSFSIDTLTQFLNRGTGSNKEYVRYAIEALNFDSDIIFRPPSFYTENGYLLFPSIDEIITESENELQELVKESLNIGQVDEKIISEGDALLTNKQKLLGHAITGAVVANNLRMEDYNYTIDAIGTKDTGKSFATKYALFKYFGRSPESRYVLKGDILNSAFRNIKVQSVSNLPIYIEEAEISPHIMKQIKSSGTSLRGKVNQSFNFYQTQTTFIPSRNSREVNDNPDEQEAVEKRMATFWFDDSDEIVGAKKKDGSMFMDKLREQKGGLIYDKLKNITIPDLKKMYYDLKGKYKDQRELLVRYGAWITGEDITQLKMDFGVEQEEDWLFDIIDWINKQENDIVKNQRIGKTGRFYGNMLLITKRLFDLYVSSVKYFPYKTFTSFGKYCKSKNIAKYYMGSLSRENIKEAIISVDMEKYGENWNSKFENLIADLTWK